MIFDSHMHVGDFPTFSVSVDDEGHENHVTPGFDFHRDNAMAREIIGRTTRAESCLGQGTKK